LVGPGMAEAGDRRPWPLVMGMSPPATHEKPVPEARSEGNAPGARANKPLRPNPRATTDGPRHTASIPLPIRSRGRSEQKKRIGSTKRIELQPSLTHAANRIWFCSRCFWSLLSASAGSFRKKIFCFLFCLPPGQLRERHTRYFQHRNAGRATSLGYILEQAAARPRDRARATTAQPGD